MRLVERVSHRPIRMVQSFSDLKAAVPSPLRFYGASRVRLCILLSLWLLLPLLIAAAPCTPDDVLSLAKAGYSKTEIDGLCQVSTAFFSRSGRLDLSSSAVARFVSSVAPVKIDIADQKNQSGSVVLNELKYCKATGEHQSELIGYGVSTIGGAIAAQPPRSPLLEDGDCTRPLDVVFKRISAIRGPTGAGDLVARMGFDWIPWELRLKALEIRARVTLSIPPARFATNLIPINIGNRVVPLSAAFYFSNDSISVMLVPSTDVATLTELSYVPKLASFADFQLGGISRTQDATVQVSHRAINYVADTYFSGDQVVIIETGIQSLGQLTMRQLHGEPSGLDSYTVSGVLSDNGGRSFLVKATAKGNDLAIASIEINPQNMTACPPISFNPDTIKCNVSNAALQAAAAVVSSGLTSAYKGKLLKTFGKPDTVHVTLGNIKFDLSSLVTHVTSAEKDLRIDASLQFKHF